MVTTSQQINAAKSSLRLMNVSDLQTLWKVGGVLEDYRIRAAVQYVSLVFPHLEINSTSILFHTIIN